MARPRTQKPRPSASGHGDLRELWDEVGRLRSELDRLKVGRGVPRFCSVDLDSPSSGSFYFECGFEPRLVYLFGGPAASTTVMTFSYGFAVYDENLDGAIYQAAAAGRRSGGGQFRQYSESRALAVLGDDNDVLDADVTIDSFDHNGFSYTVSGAATVPILRGFAVGY